MEAALLPFLFLSFLAGPSLAAADIWNENLAWWIGKYPTSAIDGQNVHILALAPLKQVLDQAVPVKERQLLSTYKVETPITAVGDFLVINQCKPHDCPSELATVVIDLKKKRLWAGFFSRRAGYVSTRWYGNADDYSVLPAQVRQEFLARHGD